MPACNAVIAWHFFSTRLQAVFRTAPAMRNATWALSFGLIAPPYNQRTNPVPASSARHAIAEAFGLRGHTSGRAP